MVITVLEAHVAQDKWESLRRAYEKGIDNLPPQMVETFLVQSSTDRTLWRGISVWRSRQALDEYRRSVETPGGIMIFRSAGAEPTVGVFEVAAHADGKR